jgi:hypothetical protein
MSSNSHLKRCGIKKKSPTTVGKNIRNSNELNSIEMLQYAINDFMFHNKNKEAITKNSKPKYKHILMHKFILVCPVFA